MAIYVIDPYYLTISFLITLAWQVTGFFIAWTLQFDKITDFTGGSNFFILALITLTVNGQYYARQIVASVLQMLWSARLGGFLLFRVLKTGSDTRFDDMRSHFFKFAGFWVFQIIWVFVVSLPVILLNSPIVSDPAYGGANPRFGYATDILGIILWAIGFFWESVGDIQKYRFKSAKPPKGAPCDKGLWKWSRHPPYFGEMTLHWGMWLLCLAPAVHGNISRNGKAAQILSIFSPLLTMALLMFLSGLPGAEKPSAKRAFLISHPPKKQPSSALSGHLSSFTPSQLHSENDTYARYKEYRERTSIIVPLPPSVYRPLPQFIKTLLGDYKMYRFDEETDGREALEEARREDA